jgi:hypothetical protein
MNTALNEIKTLSAKCLRKLENHTNTLAMSLLDNGETTHKLPNSLEQNYQHKHYNETQMSI